MKLINHFKNPTNKTLLFIVVFVAIDVYGINISNNAVVFMASCMIGALLSMYNRLSKNENENTDKN